MCVAGPRHPASGQARCWLLAGAELAARAAAGARGPGPASGAGNRAPSQHTPTGDYSYTSTLPIIKILMEKRNRQLGDQEDEVVAPGLGHLVASPEMIVYGLPNSPRRRLLS